jgi:hypothetical protein
MRQMDYFLLNKQFLLKQGARRRGSPIPSYYPLLGSRWGASDCTNRSRNRKGPEPREETPALFCALWVSENRIHWKPGFREHLLSEAR